MSPESAPFAPRPRKRVRLLALAGVMLATLLAVELVLRLVRFATPTGIAYLSDSRVGHRLRPGYRAWYRGEGEAFFTVNSDGMPDRERAKIKPQGTFRIAVIGDSFTEAMGMPRERRFTAVMERHLTTCSVLGGNVEVLAFGASAYGPAHELLAMRTQVWQYSPDIVLLQLFLPNDLRGSVRELSGSAPAPFFVEVNGEWQLDSASRHLPGPKLTGFLASLEGEAYRWLRSLHLIQAVRVARRMSRLAETSALKDTVYGFEPGADWQVFVPPPTTEWERAWRTTEGLLRVIRDEAQAHSARLFVVSVPAGIEVHPVAARREAFLARLGPAARLEYPGDRVRAIQQRDGIATLDLAPPMRSHAERTQEALYGHANAVPGLGHWNAAGHRVAGETIARWICNKALGAGVSDPDLSPGVAARFPAPGPS